ncbi:hypothetical protein [Rhodoferax antarcticus]|uniref:Uncharacterized protein n=1 Tax=Rhodoferax antarcticus ANT.BR TaxID=1111071 RepID=A0A1Q8Y9D5_9BURK|nr:hypothetical protein [Rhodoferax antarcticus]OLP04618.1 hypothetical protein BLL52_4093 [Rhodoferax antarcticus ANT.BR]
MDSTTEEPNIEPTDIKPIKRPFISVSAKDNTFLMKVGSALAGGVVVALLVATGVMWWKDKVAKENVPTMPPVDAIVQKIAPPIADAVALPALAADGKKNVEIGASGAASAASAPETASSDSQPAVAAEVVNPIDLGELSKRVDDMQAQFEDVNKTIDELQKRVNSQAVRLRAATTEKATSGTDMRIVQISPASVEVMVGVKKYIVMPGGQLPGGATYIGFDAAKSMMRTDRGDFQIN